MADEPSQQISDGTVKQVAERFDNFFDDLWSYTGSENSRLNSALISYFDRLVLLAGGSLTLTFTVVANLSAHLQSVHRSASHPRLIMASFWLLIGSVVFGLLANYAVITAQRHSSTQKAVMRAHSRLVRGMAYLNPAFNPKNLDPLKEQLTAKSRLPLVANILNFCTHGCLVLAFTFIALFVQANLTLLLSTP